jgi:hypothetical protein
MDLASRECVAVWRAWGDPDDRSVMFFSYVWHELRRRMRQAIVISLGLALGIGLVITVTAASSGVKSAEGKVLHSLYGVGTDVTVTNSPKAGLQADPEAAEPPRSIGTRWFRPGSGRFRRRR